MPEFEKDDGLLTLIENKSGDLIAFFL